MKFLKNHNFKLSLNLFLGLVLFSCKRDSEIISPNDNTNYSNCENIPPFQQVGSGYTYITTGQIFNFPVFNPNNNNELLITKNDSVFIFNRLLNQKNFSFKFPFWNKISWSKQNWIIMGGTDQKIYKIKPNGDSLTLLVNNSNNFYPIWNNTGTQFCIQNNTINKAIRFNNQGIPIDTFQQLTIAPFSDWNSNNQITWGLYTLYLYELNSNSNQTIKTLPNGQGSILGSFWLNNNEIIWSYTYGIFKTNILTNLTTTLKTTCNSNTYSFPTFDSTLNKIIWKKQLQKLIDPYTIRVENKIVMTDIDCTNEVDIPIN